MTLTAENVMKKLNNETPQFIHEVSKSIFWNWLWIWVCYVFGYNHCRTPLTRFNRYVKDTSPDGKEIKGKKCIETTYVCLKCGHSYCDLGGVPTT